MRLKSLLSILFVSSLSLFIASAKCGCPHEEKDDNSYLCVYKDKATSKDMEIVATPKECEKLGGKLMNHEETKISNLPEQLQRYVRNIQAFTVKNVYEGSEYKKIVKAGQTAKVLVISCSDSLVDPAILMGAEPNELFVHRNIAAIVPSYPLDEPTTEPDATGAVLEFGVNHLEVTDIIVIGHGHCGGMKALLKGFKPKDPNHTFIQNWINHSDIAHQKLLESNPNLDDPEVLHELEKGSVKLSLSHLMQYPWIKKRVEEGSLRLHGLHYNLGTLSVYNADKGEFEIVDSPKA